VTGAFGRAAAALVVDLGGGDVAVPEHLLNLGDVRAGINEEGDGGGFPLRPRKESGSMPLRQGDCGPRRPEVEDAENAKRLPAEAA
jgi:hypothetical protein